MISWSDDRDETSAEADSLVALLRRRASEDPTAELFSFLPDGEAAGAIVLTRGELDRRARALAIAAAGPRPGGPAGRCCSTRPGSSSSRRSSAACTRGVVAVPAYPPRPNRPMTRLRAIVEDARPSVVLTCASLRKDCRAVVGRECPGSPASKCSTPTRRPDDRERGSAEWVDPGCDAPTRSRSSSTPRAPRRHPKGVMITPRQPARQLGADPGRLRLGAGGAAASSGCRCSTTWG